MAYSKLVSVIVPAYNRAHLITETLDSVYNQSYRPIECVVVDDGSTDKTPEVVRRWKRSHSGDRFDLQLLRQKNMGAQVARNEGMATATGGYYFFLDSDDKLTEDALTTLVLAQQEQDADVFYGDYTWIFEDGRQPTVRKQMPKSESSVVSVLKDCPRTSTALVDRRVIGKTRWRDIPRAHEFTFFLDLALDGAVFKRIDEVVLRALNHSGEFRIQNECSDSVLRNRVISLYLLEVESDLRAHGKEANEACDRALLYFSGLLASQGEQELAERLLARAHPGRFLRRNFSEFSVPGRFPLFVSLIGVRGTEVVFHIKRALQSIFR